MSRSGPRRSFPIAAMRMRIARGSAGGGARLAHIRRCRVAPEFLELVEIADFGSEQVYEDVAGVDQDPVAMAFALDRYAAYAGVLEAAADMVGHRAHLSVRLARCNDH